MPKTIHTKKYREVIGRLRAARIDFGLTQKQVSQKLNLSQSYISKVEAGEQRIDILELTELANIYKKNINFFLE